VALDSRSPYTSASLRNTSVTELKGKENQFNRHRFLRDLGNQSWRAQATTGANTSAMRPGFRMPCSFIQVLACSNSARP
jgi:hypothetical protein